MCLLIIPKHMQSHIPRIAAPRNIKTAMISMIQPITWAPFFPLCLQELVLILLPIFHFPLLFILICRLLKRPAKSRQRRERGKLGRSVHSRHPLMLLAGGMRQIYDILIRILHNFLISPFPAPSALLHHLLFRHDVPRSARSALWQSRHPESSFPSAQHFSHTSF